MTASLSGCLYCIVLYYANKYADNYAVTISDEATLKHTSWHRAHTIVCLRMPHKAPYLLLHGITTATLLPEITAVMHRTFGVVLLRKDG